MKRILLFLALAVAFVAVASCEKTAIISVDAEATLIYPTGFYTQVSPQRFNFSRRTLSDYDLEYMFENLIKDANQNFGSAILKLEVYDAVSGEHLSSESYGVVYNSHDGRYDFAALGN